MSQPSDSPASIDPRLFAKALQVESGSDKPLDDDEIIASTWRIMRDSDDPILSEIGQRLAAGEAVSGIAHDPLIGPELDHLAEQYTEKFTAEVLGELVEMNAELKDLFEPDDD